MRRMSRQPLPRRGATVMVVAAGILVIFGMAAFVIDVGALYQERRELQNGADAAVLAVARDCAVSSCTFVTTDHYLLADQYVDANAGDGDANVLAGNITMPTTNTVEILASTADAGADIDSDPSTVDFVFARVLGHRGSIVSASATATWGYAGGGSTLPITIGQCEWEEATNGGTDYAQFTQTDPYDFDPADQRMLYFHFGSGPPTGGATEPPSTDCYFGPGQDVDDEDYDPDRLPGGFGWLDQGDCLAALAAPGYVDAEAGVAAPNGCEPEDFLGKVLALPLFDDIPADASECPGNPASGKCYRIVGFAGFYVAGMWLSGGQWHLDDDCVDQPRGPNRYFCGYFIEHPELDPGWDMGGQNFGVTVVKLVG